MARRNDTYYRNFIPTAANIGKGRKRKVNKNCPGITSELVAEAVDEYLREGGKITVLDPSGPVVSIAGRMPSESGNKYVRSDNANGWEKIYGG
jgi:hypothetical protein